MPIERPLNTVESGARRLTRADGRAAAPVRIVHLGLGNFFRAHTCWYTEHAGDAGLWGIAAFSGRSASHVADLQAQDELYSLLIQGLQRSSEVISAISAVHTASDLAAWRDYFTRPHVHLVTSSITEGGYLRAADGNLALSLPAVQADLAALSRDHSANDVTTAPGRFVAGLLARRAANAGPITFVPCDNVINSGQMVRTVVTQFAAAVDPSLTHWIEDNVGFVSTMVDRITPGPTPADIELIQQLTGVFDPAGVVTEPFTEWVLEDGFRSPRPMWEAAGAQFVADIVPFEQRKLWLLNGAHSLMAYLGPLRGHETVQQAIADPVIAGWVNQWWDEAGPHVPLPTDDVAAYRRALLERFTNPALRDVLARIAADGSQKLPIRFGPVIRAELAAGRTPVAALRAIAGWICHLRRGPGSVNDTLGDQVIELGRGSLDNSVAQVLAFLDLPACLSGEVTRLATAVSAQE